MAFDLLRARRPEDSRQSKVLEAAAKSFDVDGLRRSIQLNILRHITRDSMYQELGRMLYLRSMKRLCRNWP